MAITGCCALNFGTPSPTNNRKKLSINQHPTVTHNHKVNYKIKKLTYIILIHPKSKRKKTFEKIMKTKKIYESNFDDLTKYSHQ